MVCRVWATSSTSCTNPYAAPMAARSTSAGVRIRPDTDGAVLGTGSTLNRWPRRCQATSRGSSTVSGPAGRSNRRASSCSTGVRAPSTVTARSAPLTVPAGFHSSRSTTARASGPVSASRTVDLGVGERAGRGRCETSWVRAQVVADGADQVQLLVVAPEQGPVAQVGDGSGAGPGVGAQQLGQGGQGHRVREGGERFGDQALPRVQSVERPAHGARGGGLGRQVGDVSGDRVGQIRAQREEPGEGVGVEPSECLGQGAGTGDGRTRRAGSVTVSGC